MLMVLEQLASIGFQTFFKAFIVHGILFGTFLFITYRILKRDRKWLNLLISLFYIFTAVGFFLNFLFVILSTEPFAEVVEILYHFTLFFLLLGTFILTVFTFLLLKTEALFSRTSQIISIILYGTLLSVLFFIPNGVTIHSSTNWNPVYNLPYFLYTMFLFSVFSVFPQLYGFIKIYARLTQEQLKKRWTSFGLGLIIVYIFAYGTLIYNFLDVDMIRLIFGYISLICAVSSAILIYFGIAKM